MFFDRVMQFLTWLGTTSLSFITLPKSWAWVSGALPLWAFGLIVAVALLLIFKIVTHLVFKVLMWAVLLVALLIFLSSLGLPVAKWFGGY